MYNVRISCEGCKKINMNGSGVPLMKITCLKLREVLVFFLNSTLFDIPGDQPETPWIDSGKKYNYKKISRNIERKYWKTPK